MWAIKFTCTADLKGNIKKGKQLKILSQMFLLVYSGAKPGAGAGFSTHRDRKKITQETSLSQWAVLPYTLQMPACFP